MSERVLEVPQHTKRLPLPVVLVCTFLLVVLLGVIDVLTGSEISFSLFYLFPILVATWLVGRRAGAFISIVSAIAWLLADFAAGQAYSHSLIPYWNMLVRVIFFLIITFLLSEVQVRLRRETDSARTDSLTGIANRRHFYELGQLQIARAERFGEPCTVAYIDIDGFKAVNDRLGHTSGDALLSQAATTIQGSIRAVDLVARMGGDEFAILLPHTDEKAAQDAVLRVSSLLSGMARDGEWAVTFSIGVVTFLRPPSSVDEMIRTADDSMYAAKQSGQGITRHVVCR
jgi:diguanylate cyclase (GGDEF)-like protein